MAPFDRVRLGQHGCDAAGVLSHVARGRSRRPYRSAPVSSSRQAPWRWHARRGRGGGRGAARGASARAWPRALRSGPPSPTSSAKSISAFTLATARAFSVALRASSTLTWALAMATVNWSIANVAGNRPRSPPARQGCSGRTARPCRSRMRRSRPQRPRRPCPRRRGHRRSPMTERKIATSCRPLWTTGKAMKDFTLFNRPRIFRDGHP